LFGVETVSKVKTKNTTYTKHNLKIEQYTGVNNMGNEMIDAALVCFIITLVGLAVGFALLKFQGD
jgi:hypothetical protein